MKEIKTYSLEELREIHETCTESDLITKNLDILQELGVEIILEASSLQEDKRFLIPISFEGKCGLINHMAQVIAQPLYDEINEHDVNSCSSERDIIRIAKRCYIVDYANMRTYDNEPVWGAVNAKGETILPIMYRSIGINDTSDVFSVQQLRPFYQYGVRGLYNKEIIPFGKFHNISSFVKGFARINYENKAIIDLQGNVIIPEGLFDNIWYPNANYDSIVCEQGGVRYTITFEMLKHLQKEYISKGRIDTSIEDIMEYQKHLQGDFSNGWETIQLDQNEL